MTVSAVTFAPPCSNAIATTWENRMPPQPIKIYCAGPLFNDAEQQEMASIATILETQGWTTFLPQRDGVEYLALLRPDTGGAKGGQNADVFWRAIFCQDVYQLLSSDVVVANLNGRVPDEGTVVEAALAWSRGIPVVAHKKDVRSAFAGSDNLMILGLCARFSDDIATLPGLVEEVLKAPSRHTLAIETALQLGADIDPILKNRQLPVTEMLARLASALSAHRI
jgi:nucleoside 2-deoxyribosyltransferase